MTVGPPPGLRGAFSADRRLRELYAEGAGIYRIVPAAVAAPRDADDLATLVRWAAATGTPLVPRGAGSGMAGHNVGTGVVVDLRAGFRAPPVVDADGRTVRAAAGLTYREVNGAAAAFGLRLPPDPSSGAFCTVGGMVATNAAGARSHRHGAVRAWVRSVEFVTADGERGTGGQRDRETEKTAAEARLSEEALPWLRVRRTELERTLPPTRKNSSGYAVNLAEAGVLLRDLLVGSEGTLALVTEVDFALAPLPAEPATLLVTLRSLDDIAPAVASLEALARPPAAIELLDRTYLDFVRAAAASRVPPDTEAVLLVEFEEPGVHDAAGAMAGIAATTVFAESTEAAARLWELRHLASPILAGLPDTMRSLQVIEDGCVPLARLAEYIAALRRIAAAHGFDVVVFGHAGDGHVHANLLADVKAKDLAPRLAQCLDETTAVQIALGGTMSGEHGDGRLRAPFLERQFGAAYVEGCRRVKAAMDPHGILNPGVKLAAGPAITGDTLKVGADAPELDAAVAAALREIERTAGYGLSRLELLDAHDSEPE